MSSLTNSGSGARMRTVGELVRRSELGLAREGRIEVDLGEDLLSQARPAAETLAEQRGVRLMVVELPWLNRIDQAWLRDSISGCQHVFTLDNHYITGGQGEMIGAALAEGGALNGALHEVRDPGTSGLWDERRGAARAWSRCRKHCGKYLEGVAFSARGACLGQA